MRSPLIREPVCRLRCRREVIQRPRDENRPINAGKNAEHVVIVVTAVAGDGVVLEASGVAVESDAEQQDRHHQLFQPCQRIAISSQARIVPSPVTARQFGRLTHRQALPSSPRWAPQADVWLSGDDGERYQLADVAAQVRRHEHQRRPAATPPRRCTVAAGRWPHRNQPSIKASRRRPRFVTTGLVPGIRTTRPVPAAVAT